MIESEGKTHTEREREGEGVWMDGNGRETWVVETHKLPSCNLWIEIVYPHP